jgi:hypothetical protein
MTSDTEHAVLDQPQGDDRHNEFRQRCRLVDGRPLRPDAERSAPRDLPIFDQRDACGGYVERRHRLVEVERPQRMPRRLDRMKSDCVQLADEGRAVLFDNWLDSIERAVRDRVRS